MSDPGPTTSAAQGAEAQNQTPQNQAPAKRNGNRNQFSRKQNRAGSTFKGAVEKMNGHVFQAHGEHTNRGEFQRTLEELQVYCSTAYVQEAGLLAPLFNKLENPSLAKPTKPTYSEDSEERSLEEDIYKEEVKVYVKTKSNLGSTLHSLFDVIWGQCSPLLK